MSVELSDKQAKHLQKKLQWAKDNPEKVKEIRRRYQDNSRDKKREYQRKWSKANPDKLRNHRGNWRKQHPEKRQACREVYNAVKKGLLNKPEKCSKCDGRGIIEGHHENYSKPLEVVWLCIFCHKRLHRDLADKEVTECKNTET